MSAADWTAVGSIAASIATIVAAVSLVLVVLQIGEAKKATYAQTFIAASTLLQDESARGDRRDLFTFGETKPFDQWNDLEQATAQRVVQKLDIVAVMVHEGMLPEKMILENWGDTYRRTWNHTQELVKFVRERAKDPTFFFRFEWLALKAVVAFKAPVDGKSPSATASKAKLPTYAADKMADAEPVRREPPVPREESAAHDRHAAAGTGEPVRGTDGAR